MNNTKIHQLRSKERQYEKSLGNGLMIVVYPSGNKTFFLRKKIDGKDKKIKIGDFPDINLERAIESCDNLVCSIQNGMKISKRQTIGDLLRLYMEEHIAFAKQTTQRCYRSYINCHMQDLMLLDIDCAPAAIRSEYLKIGRRSRYTANRVLDIVRASYKHSFLTDPTAKIVRFKEVQRERLLTDDELNNLLNVIRNWEHCSQGVRDYFEFIILSGLRRREASGLTWDMINLQTNIITLPDSKTGISHRSISLTCSDFLKELKKKKSSGYVFLNHAGKPCNDVDRTWRGMRRAAGLPKLRIHDLRHNFIGTLVNNGVSLKIASAASGHKSLRSVERYAHLDNARVAAALDAHAPKR